MTDDLRSFVTTRVREIFEETFRPLREELRLMNEILDSRIAGHHGNGGRHP